SPRRAWRSGRRARRLHRRDDRPLRARLRRLALSLREQCVSALEKERRTDRAVERERPLELSQSLDGATLVEEPLGCSESKVSFESRRPHALVDLRRALGLTCGRCKGCVLPGAGGGRRGNRDDLRPNAELPGRSRGDSEELADRGIRFGDLQPLGDEHAGLVFLSEAPKAPSEPEERRQEPLRSAHLAGDRDRPLPIGERALDITSSESHEAAHLAGGRLHVVWRGLALRDDAIGIGKGLVPAAAPYRVVQEVRAGEAHLLAVAELLGEVERRSQELLRAIELAPLREEDGAVIEDDAAEG